MKVLYTTSYSTEVVLKLHIMLRVLEANLIKMWTYSTLTSIRRVGSRAVEETGWAAQVAHGRAAVAVHASGHAAVAALLRCWARHIAMRRHAACIPIEAWGKQNERDSQIIFAEHTVSFSHFLHQELIRSSWTLFTNIAPLLLGFFRCSCTTRSHFIVCPCLHYVAKTLMSRKKAHKSAMVKPPRTFGRIAYVYVGVSRGSR